MSSLMLGRGSNYRNENLCENPISNLKIDKTELLDVSVTELYTKFNFPWLLNIPCRFIQCKSNQIRLHSCNRLIM